ncbi:hypothetical protein [Halobaculum limi]|nr:hypothetical protein [Halobaculum sp. YSMS11]
MTQSVEIFSIPLVNLGLFFGVAAGRRASDLAGDTDPARAPLTARK